MATGNIKLKELSLTLLLVLSCLGCARGQGSLIFVSKMGELRSRVYCREVVQCIGIGDRVLWSLFGLGVDPIEDTDTRFTNTSSEVINNMTVITANLTFDPLITEHQTIYVCNVEGDNNVNTNFRVFVEPEPVIIASDIPNVDISSRTIGETITIGCQVETCLSDVIVTFYKNENVLNTSTITNNMLKSFTYAYTLIVGIDSPGEYACRAVTTKGATPLKFFNVTGTPLLPSTIGITTTSTSTLSSSTTTSISSVGVVPSNTPVVSVSPTPGGGATEMLAQWTLLLSLLLVTMLSVMMI